MRMNRWGTWFVFGLWLAGVSVADAQAQGLQPYERGFVGVGFAVQSRSQTIQQQFAFPLYDEIARFEGPHVIEGGPTFDISGAVRLVGNLGVGVAVTRVNDNADVSLTGQVPHPLFFGRPRSASATTSGLERTEVGIHFQAVWFVAASDKVDLAFTVGPSVFRVTQELVQRVGVREVGTPFTSVTVDSVAVGGEKETGVGFNLGVDGTYMFTQRLGAGAFVRYAGGSVELSGFEGRTIELDTGGFQAGLGVRVKF